MLTPSFKIQKKLYGNTNEGVEVDLYILKNKNGMEISIITLGGIITSWTAKDKNDNYENIVLGYDTLSDYEINDPYLGAIIGRYGNRIANGTFKIDDKEYLLETNNGPNHLHGGLKGFDKKVWKAKTLLKESEVSLILSYESKDMEEGYPGNLKAQVTYTLNNNDELSVLYEATTDKPTVVNLTNHSYFNLSADFNNNVLDHHVYINAQTFLPVDQNMIPTGELREVLKTPFDFNEPKQVGDEIDENDQQLIYGNGYDHCWVLNQNGIEQTPAASVYHSETRRFLEIFTDKPGVQFYTGNFLDEALSSTGIKDFSSRSGLCLETQHFPDSPNQKSFPSVVLEHGEKYKSKTTFKFSVK